MLFVLIFILEDTVKSFGLPVKDSKSLTINTFFTVNLIATETSCTEFKDKNGFLKKLPFTMINR